MKKGAVRRKLLELGSKFPNDSDLGSATRIMIEKIKKEKSKKDGK